VVTAAGLAFAWYLLIQPVLGSATAAGGWSLVLTFGYPLGDVVLLALAVTLLLIPGRRTAAELMIVAGLSVSLLADIGNALLPAQAGSDRWYLPTYLLINATLTAALVHPAQSTVLRPLNRGESGQDMRGWRMALLGVALCGVGLSMMLLPNQGWDRMPAAVAMVVMISVILSRLRRAVTDLEDAERSLRHQATHDQLTGLANRSRLLADMRDAVRESPTLFFVDLDGFKAVNDTHGHHSGDLVLRAVAERLTRVVRNSDTVARLGGDEFVVVCTGLTESDTTALCRRIESALAEPIDIGDDMVVIGCSIGVLSRPAVDALSEQEAEDLISDLLSAADAAMYEAKRSGGGTRIVNRAHAA
jgi:diguanylate cyclase (GGDEF)-like protein